MVQLPCISTSPIVLRKENVAEVGHIGGEVRARCNMLSYSRREPRVIVRIILRNRHAAIREVEDVRQEGGLGRIPIDQDKG